MKNRGFTLIELLVVISIIGFLSSIVLASLNTARSKARDAQRISDMKQLQNALELYRNDHNSYPISSTDISGCFHNGFCGDCGETPGKSLSDSDVFKPLISGGYIPSIPKDPTGNPSGCFSYEYFSQPETFTGHISDNGGFRGLGGYGCNGIDLTKYSYVIRFSTENPQNFPVFGYSGRSKAYEYCAVMNR